MSPSSDDRHQTRATRFISLEAGETGDGTIAGIAHEISGPLGAILIAAQYGRMALGRPDAHRIVEKVLSDIEQDARACAEITDSLMDGSLATRAGSFVVEADVDEAESRLRIRVRRTTDAPVTGPRRGGTMLTLDLPIISP